MKRSDPRITVLLGFHAHQPVGNFPWVIEDAVRLCYRPFLEIAENHPAVRFSLHISGWLLDLLARKHPAEIASIARMIERGQAEIIGGGDTEPVLAAIPERDRINQLQAMNARLERTFGVRPRGAWLTERVWENSVVPALAATGIRFTAVDDYHFLAAGRTRQELTGYFTTEEAGQRLDLFPIAQPLRYAIPFKPARTVIAMMESLPPGSAAVYFDDLEKFGVWPATHRVVYRKGWLEAFFTALDASDRLVSATFGDYHRRNPARGLVYLPTTSYFEMGEWALPAARARRLGQLIHRAKREHTLESDRPLLRGGIWKNFLTKYPEANWMHKRVEHASLRLHKLKTKAAQSPVLRAALHRAQANDAYWHGVFGGVYLPFLRRSVYANLADLERGLDAIDPQLARERRDLDDDGRDEIALRDGTLFVAVRPHDGGSICELTDSGLHHNFADALARREEEYHATVRRLLSRRSVTKRRAGARSIHEQVALPPHLSAADLDIDTVSRGLCVDVWHGAGQAAQPLAYELNERAGAVRRGVRNAAAKPEVSLVAHHDQFDLAKRLRIARKSVHVDYTFRSRQAVRGVLEMRADVAMPSANGKGGSYIIGRARRGRLDAQLRVGAAHALTLRDVELPGSFELTWSPRCALTTSPLWTVSRSEAGFEKIMQAATVTLRWPVRLRAGERLEVRVMLRPAKARS